MLSGSDKTIQSYGPVRDGLNTHCVTATELSSKAWFPRVGCVQQPWEMSIFHQFLYEHNISGRPTRLPDHLHALLSGETETSDQHCGKGKISTAVKLTA